MPEHFHIEICIILPQLTFISSLLFLLIVFEIKCIELKYWSILLEDSTNTLQNQSSVKEVLCPIAPLTELIVVMNIFHTNDSESCAADVSVRDKTESRMTSQVGVITDRVRQSSERVSEYGKKESCHQR